MFGPASSSGSVWYGARAVGQYARESAFPWAISATVVISLSRPPATGMVICITIKLEEHELFDMENVANTTCAGGESVLRTFAREGSAPCTARATLPESL